MVQIRVTPPRGTFEWYKWMVERLGKDAAANVSAKVPDGELRAEVYLETYNYTRRALIQLLADMGVFKEVKEIHLQRGGKT